MNTIGEWGTSGGSTKRDRAASRGLAATSGFIFLGILEPRRARAISSRRVRSLNHLRNVVTLTAKRVMSVWSSRRWLAVTRDLTRLYEAMTRSSREMYSPSTSEGPVNRSNSLIMISSTSRLFAGEKEVEPPARYTLQATQTMKSLHDKPKMFIYGIYFID